MLLEQKLHILVVEDNIGDFILIEEYLEEEMPHAVVHHAKTFQQAKNILKKDIKPDVILLDLTLPDAGGEKLVNESVLIAQEAPLIVLTGYSNIDFSIRSLALGAADYLLKDDLSASQLYKSISYSLERKRINSELKRSEEKYRNLFHSSPLPMWVYDPDTLKFLDVNESACSNYGYSKKEFLAMTILDIRPAKDSKKIEKIVSFSKKHGGFYQDIFSHFKKSGELIDVDIQSNNIDFDGKTARLVLATDVTEKIKAERARTLSEQRFKALVQDGSDLVAILDKTGNYAYVSPTSQSILGMPPEYFVGKNAFNFIHPEDKARVINQFTLLGSQKRMSIMPFRFRLISGEYRWIETIITNMLDDPSIGGVVANSRDVSERYIFEEKLRKQEALFRAIIEKSSDMKTLITPEGKILFGTPSITSILGYSRNEYIGLNEKNIVHPDDLALLFSKINEVILKKGSIGNILIRVRHKNGEYRWCDKTITNLLHDTDVNALVCNFVDVTENKTAELKIKESNERYNLVSKATSDAIWDYDFAKDMTFIAGTGYLFLFGYDIVNAYTDPMFWESRLHPEDKDTILEKLRLFIEDKSLNQFSYEYRFLKANGTYAHVNDRLFIIRENGNPIRLIGAINDITKKKEEEQQLRLLESVVTNTNDSVIVTEAYTADPNGPKIIYVNEAFSNMSGYSREEMIGKTPRMFQGPESDKEELRKLKVALENNQPVAIEIINYKKNGQRYWVSIDIDPVTDNTGKVTHFIAIEKDITSRKVQQQEKERLIFELIQNNKDLRQFSYITSHNLRGPVANLLGLTNLIDNYKIEDPTLKQILDGIKKATNMFDETIKDLSTVLNLKDRTSIPREEIELTAIFEKVTEQCKTAIDENCVQVSTDFVSAPFINFNKAYLESILLNLLTNAIKYKSRARRLKVRITTEKTEKETVLKFQDNGQGIDLNLHRDKIFRLYQRFHEHTDGKGLGLFLVKSQLEALNSSIDIESKVDEGTSFILKFKN